LPRLVIFYVHIRSAQSMHMISCASGLGRRQRDPARTVIALIAHSPLEDQLGVRLLDRTPQGSRLTEAGQVFLPQAQALLRSARQAAVTACAAASPGRITIGYVGDFIITPAVRDLRCRHLEAEVRTRHLDWNDGHTALPEHRVDAIVARMPFPFPAERLRVTVLYDEPRVLVVPTFHRLAGKESVTLDDFADEPPALFPGTATAWSAFWRLEPRPGGRPAHDGPVVETFEDKLELVASGQAIAILPAGDQRSTLCQDLTTVPHRRDRTMPGRGRHPRQRAQPPGRGLPRICPNPPHRHA
jgi:DNA-binding transcriptional LysR family regulator